MTSNDKVREKNLFSAIASNIPKITAGSNVVSAFEVLAMQEEICN